MIRLITFGGVLVFLTAASPVKLLAQFNPYVSRPNPYPYGPGADPRVRRAYREQAVAYVGPIARDLVETHGDEAVAAIFACSKATAVKLASFHASGELGMLPRPRDLLFVIAQPHHADDVALWAIAHARELREVDSFNAYLLHPLHYAMGLKPLEAGAAEARARRLNQAAMLPPPAAPPAPPPVPPLSADAKLAIAGGAGLITIIGFLWWRRRRKAAIC
jgi:hypothetical protein